MSWEQLFDFLIPLSAVLVGGYISESAGARAISSAAIQSRVQRDHERNMDEAQALRAVYDQVIIQVADASDDVIEGLRLEQPIRVARGSNHLQKAVTRLLLYASDDVGKTVLGMLTWSNQLIQVTHALHGHDPIMQAVTTSLPHNTSLQEQLGLTMRRHISDVMKGNAVKPWTTTLPAPH